MKKALIIAALAIAALTMMAQTPDSYMKPIPSDSVSIMLRHLANTNAELNYVNESLRLHSQLVVGSFASAGLSAFMFYIASTCDPPTHYNETDSGKQFRFFGYAFAAASAGLFIGSYVPIWTKHIHLDNRGLVIDIDRKNGKK